MTNESGPASPEAAAKPKHRKRPKETRAFYGAVLQAFRAHPGNVSAAAKESGYTRPACRRLWNKGWPGKPWARPIKDVVAEELDEARAEGLRKAQVRRDQQAAAQEAKRQAFMREIEEEAIMASGVRKTVLGTTAILASMQQSMLAVSNVIRKAVLDDQGKPIPNPKLSALEAMKLLREYTQSTARLAYAEQIVIDIGRVSRGEEPTSTKGDKLEKMDAEQVREHLKLLRELSDELEAEQKGDLVDAEQVH